MFIFSLADRFGKTVAELKATMSVSELMHWAAFFRIRERQLKVS